MYIDAHVHFRDFNQRHETVAHGLEVALDSGVDAVFDMPNTDPPILTSDAVIARLKLAQDAKVKNVFYGLYVGLTADPEQVKRAVDISREFSQVVGMKLYAGHSVGELGVTKEEDQYMIYETLTREGYDGVLAVHCEKEAFMDAKVWNHQQPITHCFARPEKAEIESVKDQLAFARKTKFTGKLHLTHISSPVAVDLVAEAKKQGLDVSSGICPHHFIYDWNQMHDQEGVLWKMNPPLREPASRERVFQYLQEGKIDWIETDHAPHPLDYKTGKTIDKDGKPLHMSGIPGIAWWPLFAEFLRKNEFSDQQIEDLTFNNILKRFNLSLDKSRRKIKDHRADYPFDPYKKMAEELKW
ncbi:dihydroorotase [Candidatus Woesearchaeota archaeon]|nr:dihydroorotase [Candidatus Woesearchaeota archaeon]